jgi:transcriptional regulator with XRE-family HTH domain
VLGDNIKKFRELKGISINALAKACNISSGYLSDIEKNKKTNPSTDVLEVIAKNLDTTVQHFFKEDISKVYIYAQSIDISESIGNISSDLDIEIECISISQKLREENNMPGDKYLGCICIAAGKL